MTDPRTSQRANAPAIPAELLEEAFSYQHSLRRLQRPATMPKPPFSEDFHQYFHKAVRHRKLAVLLQAASFGSLYGIWAVFSKSWVWWPFLATLLVFVPWKLFSLYVTARRPGVTAGSHAGVLASGWRTRLDPVDVFLPIAGESSEIIYNTFHHVARLRWDGPLTVHVLDDGGDPFAAALCREYGFSYHARPDRGRDRKSGNLNYGLAVSAGAYIAVFDADFAPAPQFLHETIPYFNDETVGIVQTAQFFGTSRRETRNWLQQFAGAIQSAFYIWAQPARQALGTAFCVGTNVVYRREALAASGGFPLVPVGEDIVTTLEMLPHGYRTVYVPLTLARGACPDNFAAAVNQQYRWCSSAWNQMAPRTIRNTIPGTYRRAPLSFRQRVVFGSAMFYYLQSILELAVAATPSLVMMWCYPWQVQPGNYLPIAPSMLGMAAMPYVIQGWRPAILRLSVVYSASHLLAFLDVMRNNTAAWVPSGQRVSSGGTPRRAAWVVRTWVAVTQGLAWAGLARDIPVYSIHAYWAALLLTVIQSAILLPLLLPGFATLGRGRQLLRELAPRRWRHADFEPL